MFAKVRGATAFGAWAAVACASEPAEVDRFNVAFEVRVVNVDRPDAPLEGIGPSEIERFRAGDNLFEAVFREADGLGPLYVRASCSDCHRDDGRGPGRVTRMGSADRALTKSQLAELLPYGDMERPYAVAGAQVPLLAPETGAVVVTSRLPPAVFGRGYIEAIADEEIERLAAAAAQRKGPIRGRASRVEGGTGKEVPLGRFGLKARAADLTEFTAQALHGDMGLTSPLYPHEPRGPEGLTDDGKPGVDVSLAEVESLADYVRLLALPRRTEPNAVGQELFSRLECATCHTPVLRTRQDYPIAQLAGVPAPVYSDLLLHDMGDELSDGVTEGDAGPREWRTAPLIGLRFSSAFLHDGRAATIEEAILAHGAKGSEAEQSVAAYRELSEERRALLIDFVSGL